MHSGAYSGLAELSRQVKQCAESARRECVILGGDAIVKFITTASHGQSHDLVLHYELLLSRFKGRDFSGLLPLKGHRS